MPARPIRTIDTSSSLNSLDAGERIVCFSPLDSLANWEQPRRIWLDPSYAYQSRRLTDFHIFVAFS